MSPFAAKNGRSSYACVPYTVISETFQLNFMRAGAVQGGTPMTKLFGLKRDQMNVAMPCEINCHYLSLLKHNIMVSLQVRNGSSSQSGTSKANISHPVPKDMSKPVSSPGAIQLKEDV